MKIGFSLSRCVGDLVSGKVQFEDVLLVTSSTKFPSKDGMIAALRQYTTASNREQYIEVATQLWDSGKLHQPRLETDGHRGLGRPGVVWMDLAPTTLTDSPAVIDAWETYKTLLTLSA